MKRKMNKIKSWWKRINPLLKGGIIGTIVSILIFPFLPLLITLNSLIERFFQVVIYRKIMLLISSATGCVPILFECAEEETAFWLIVILLMGFVIGMLIQFVRYRIKSKGG